MSDLDSSDSNDSQGETKRRAIYPNKIFIPQKALWSKLWKLPSHFGLNSSTQFLLIQWILQKGEKRKGNFGLERCITDARFDSKKSLAEAFGCKEQKIKDAEQALRDKDLLESTGRNGSKVRVFAVSEKVINYLVCQNESRENSPSKVEKSLSQSRENSTHSNRTSNTSLDRAPTTNLASHYDAINRITGEASPGVKNPIFKEMLKEHGEEIFCQVIGKCLQEKIIFVWEHPKHPGEIHIDKLSHVFSDLVTQLKES